MALFSSVQKEKQLPVPGLLSTRSFVPWQVVNFIRQALFFRISLFRGSIPAVIDQFSKNAKLPPDAN
jgi:hypothetical protein